MTPHPEQPVILVVDDDVPTQNLLKAVLRYKGYGADVAANGGEAIEMLEARSYAGVVLDMMMPAVSGFEVVEFLSRSARPIPVIVCSAAGPKALTGFDPDVVKAVLRKPFDIEELMEALTAAIEGAGDGR